MPMSHGPRRRVVAVLTILACVALLRPESARTVDASTLTARSVGVQSLGVQSLAEETAAGSQPTPPWPDRLPADIEPLSPYLKQVSCNPVDQPGSVALGNLLRATYPGTSYSVGRACGADGIASEHYEGRAVDWFVSVRVPEQAARAQAFLDWLMAPDAAGRPYAGARRLGVMYLIWDGRIWGSYAAASGWRPYAGCASRTERSWDTTCHRDHIHISLGWSGGMGRTSYWTGTVDAVDYGPCRPTDLNWAPPYTAPRRAPCPDRADVPAPSGAAPLLASLVRYSGATVWLMSTGPVVRAVQQALGLTPDGAFGPLTTNALTTFQRDHGLTTTGRTDAATWRALLAAAGASPGPADPSSGPASGPAAPPTPTPTPTPSRPRTVAEPPVVSSPPVTSPPSTPTSPKGPTTPTGTGTGTGVTLPISYGAKGSVVLALQKRMGVDPASGWFGPKTWSAVAAVQRARGLPVTGVVDLATWRAIRSG